MELMAVAASVVASVATVWLVGAGKAASNLAGHQGRTPGMT